MKDAKYIDGLRRDGKEAGKLRFFARIVVTHPDTKRKIVDTERKILADSRSDAVVKRAALAEELANKKLGRLGQSARIKLADAVDGYVNSLSRFNTKRVYRSCGERLKEAFPDRWLDSLKLNEMQRWLASLKHHSHSHAGSHRSVLVNTFEWAADEGHVQRPNIARDTRVRVQRDARQNTSEVEEEPKRDLTAEEMDRFMPALYRIDADVYILVLTMFVLGQRFSETSALKRADVDWSTGIVKVVRAQSVGNIGPPKGNRARKTALPPTALAMLRGHVADMDRRKWPGHDEWLFPVRPHKVGRPRSRPDPFWGIDYVSARIKAAMEAADVHTVNATHFARHTMIGMMKGEVSEDLMRRVVGHTEKSRAHDRYGSAKVQHVASVAERVLAIGPRAK